MAEAIGAFALAAGVVQFIDFGSRVTSKFWAYYKAQSENLDDAPDIDVLISDLESVLKELQTCDKDGKQDGLAQLAQECQIAATQLKAILEPMINVKKRHQEDEKRREEDEKRQKDNSTSENELSKTLQKLRRLKQDTRHSAARLKVALKVVWKEDQISGLNSKIRDFRSQLTLHLLTSLRALAHENVAFQNRVLETLNTLSNKPRATVSIENSGFAAPILDFVTSRLDDATRGDMKLHLEHELHETIQESYSSGSDQTPSLSMTPARESVLQSRIIESLAYKGMKDREGRITETFGDTFKWIFKDSPTIERKWVNFKDWLQSDSQLYWITGKAGSGKSTLMKYICEDDAGATRSTDTAESGQCSRSARFLKSWANGEAVVLATFYFWNASVPEQRTQTGLYRSLLHQLLGSRPDLIPVVVPRRWEVLHLFDTAIEHWSEQELGTMLKETATLITASSHLCMFVDGLDEFDGQPSALIGLFKDLASKPKLKLCLASRSWVEFEDAFSHGPSLRLQDLTFEDMKEYISRHMEENDGYKFLQQREPNFAAQLQNDILVKSAGVFLWVKLVVASILGGMAYGDRVSDLRKRLDALPPELEDLYDRMLSSLDPFYLEHAAQLFRFVQASDSPPSLLVLALADEDNAFLSAIRDEAEPFEKDQVDLIHEAMRRRVNSRCKGLLEIGRTSPPIDWTPKGWFPLALEASTVQYLHRTVKDYIESEKVQERLKAAMRSPHDPHLSHCIGTLIQMKRTPYLPHSTGGLWLLFRDQVNSFLTHARAVLPENGAKLRDLMDSFDVTCCVIESRVSRSAVSANSWCRMMMPDTLAPFNAHLSSLATRCGILQYVKSVGFEPKALVAAESLPGRIKYSCSYQLNLYPLLLDAVTALWDSLWPQCYAPHLDMVAYLLEAGADPNEYITPGYESGKPFTVWRAALAIPRDKYEQIWAKTNDESWRHWLQAYDLMLKHGAGHFKNAARLHAQNSVRRLNSRVVFSLTDWESLIKELSQGRELPNIYGKIYELQSNTMEKWDDGAPWDNEVLRQQEVPWDNEIPRDDKFPWDIQVVRDDKFPWDIGILRDDRDNKSEPVKSEAPFHGLDIKGSPPPSAASQSYETAASSAAPIDSSPKDGKISPAAHGAAVQERNRFLLRGLKRSLSPEDGAKGKIAKTGK